MYITLIKERQHLSRYIPVIEQSNRRVGALPEY